MDLEHTRKYLNQAILFSEEMVVMYEKGGVKDLELFSNEVHHLTDLRHIYSQLFDDFLETFEESVKYTRWFFKSSLRIDESLWLDRGDFERKIQEFSSYPTLVEIFEFRKQCALLFRYQGLDSVESLLLDFSRKCVADSDKLRLEELCER